MLHWLRYPFLRLTPVFATGILLFEFLARPRISFVIPAILFVSILFFFLATRKKFFSLNPFLGIAFLIVMTVFGLIHSSFRYQLNSPDHFSHKDFRYYIGVVDSWPEERNGYIRTTLWVQFVKDSTWEIASGKVQVYIPRNHAGLINYGSVVVVNGIPDISRGSQNPYEFNYKRYLSFKNIFHQQFLQDKDFIVTGKEYPNRLKLISGKLRDRAGKVLENNIERKDRLGIAKAMLLGDRSDMDVEIREAYAHTGAMHILAISGLHVGILYGLLAMLLAPLRRSRRGKFVFTFIILVILWFYASIVGASPSVMRAVVMFSLIGIGQAFFRTPDIFNIIAFSAFFLLMIDPFQLFEVGFQLSYLAVIGIILIYRKINSWISSRYWIINTIWSITSVAIAAQLMTFPISLYYFHNFPNLFFLSNLLVIPSAMVIVISGISLLVISVFTSGVLAVFLGKVVSYTIGVMNTGVSTIESLPYSYVSDIYLSASMVTIIYLLIFSGLALFISKNVRWLYLLVFVWSVFIIVLTVSEVKKEGRQLLMIYDIPGTTVLDFVSGGKIGTLSGRDTLNDIGYNVDNFRIAMAGTKKPDPLLFSEGSTGFKVSYFGNKSLVWIDHGLNDSLKPQQKVLIDFLLISNNSVNNLDLLLENFTPGMIVFDSSNNYFYSTMKIEALKQRGLKVISTRVSGGILIDLKSEMIINTPI